MKCLQCFMNSISLFCPGKRGDLLCIIRPGSFMKGFVISSWLFKNERKKLQRPISEILLDGSVPLRQVWVISTFFAEEPLILWCFLLLEFCLKSSPAALKKHPWRLTWNPWKRKSTNKNGQIHEFQLQNLENPELNYFGNPRWPAAKS